MTDKWLRSVPTIMPSQYTTQSSGASFDRMPEDIVTLILGFCRVEDILRLERVSLFLLFGSTVVDV